MQIELWPLARLCPYPRHARRTAPAVGAVAESIRRFGFRQPIVVDVNGMIVCGHVRHRAAGLLGLRRVPVHVARGLTAAEVRAYRLADNKLAELAPWDPGMLAEELAALQAVDVDLEGLGFSERELVDLIGEPAPAEAVPGRPKRPASRRGQLYRLGRHRLLVGDARQAADVRRVLGRRAADLLLTDPPYNVDYRGGTAQALGMVNDAMEEGPYRRFLVESLAAADAGLRPGAAFYLWHAETEGLAVRLACAEVGWTVRQCLVWVKQALVLGRQDYQWRHEPCLYGWKEGPRHTWLGRRRQTSVLRLRDQLPVTPVADGLCLVVDGRAYLVRGAGLTVQPYATTVLEAARPIRSADHPTTKPLGVFEELIRNSARRGDIVLDPFAGSGTTILAAQRCGRVAVALEIDPGYADVCRRRWAELVYGVGCDWVRLTPAAE